MLDSLLTHQTGVQLQRFILILDVLLEHQQDTIQTEVTLGTGMEVHLHQHVAQQPVNNENIYINGTRYKILF